jgi:hypothetical protein
MIDHEAQRSMKVTTNSRKYALFAAALTSAALSFASAHAQEAEHPDTGERVTHDTVDKAGESDIAKESENPIGNLTILPFENYTNFDVGPHNGVQNILQFEPVVPVHLNDDWTLINRAIVPPVWNPSYAPAHVARFGLAPTDYEGFISPSHSVDGWTWGVGPVVQIPTATSPTLGSSVWGLGPTAVLVKTTDHIVAGVLVNNVFSLGGHPAPYANRYSQFLVEPFINYNFGHGWFIATAPLITDNQYGTGTKWTVPIGGVGGRIIRLGKLPVKLSIGAYYNVVRPEYGATWTLQSTVAFIF